MVYDDTSKFAAKISLHSSLKTGLIDVTVMVLMLCIFEGVPFNTWGPYDNIILVSISGEDPVR